MSNTTTTTRSKSHRICSWLLLCLLSVLALQQLYQNTPSSYRQAFTTTAINMKQQHDHHHHHSNKNNDNNDDNDESHLICIVTLTRSDGFAQRARQREFCRQQFYSCNHSSVDDDHYVPHMFSVGLPSFDNRKPARKQQGSLATPLEQNVSEQMLQEHHQHGDLLLSPNRDYYVDKTSKRLAIIQYGVQHNCQYTFKVDDEYCLNTTLARDLIAQHEARYPHDDLYLGNYLWKGKEYPIMAGPHGETAPFLSGHVNGLSRRVSQRIVSPAEWVRSNLVAHYGTSSEDANVGRWVQYIDHKYKTRTRLVQHRKLKVVMPAPVTTAQTTTNTKTRTG